MSAEKGDSPSLVNVAAESFAGFIWAVMIFAVIFAVLMDGGELREFRYVGF